MPLQFQLVQAPFRFGLSEGLEPRQAPPGTLMTAENVVWKKSGRIEKRQGTASFTRSIVTGGATPAFRRLATLGDDLIGFGEDEGIYSWSPGASAWRRVPGAPRPIITWDAMIDFGVGVASSDSVIIDDKLVIAWASGDPTDPSAMTVWVQVLDATTGATIFGPQMVSTSPAFRTFRIVAIGTTAYIVGTLGTNVQAFTFDASTLSLNTTPTVLRTDVAVQTTFDAMTEGGQLVIAYDSSSTLRVVTFSAALAQVATRVLSGEAGTSFFPLSVAVNSARVFVAYRVPGVGVKYAVFDRALATQTVGPVLVEAVTTGMQRLSSILVSATQLLVAYSADDFATNVFTTSIVVDSAGTVATGTRRSTVSTAQSTRPFQVGSRFYIGAIDSLNTYGSPFLGLNSYFLELPTTASAGALASSTRLPHPYVGKSMQLNAGKSVLPSTFVPYGNGVIGVLPQQTEISQNASAIMAGIRVHRIVSEPSLADDHERSVTFGRETYFAAGVVSAYDGRIAFDYGGAREPTFFSVTADGVGSMAAGSYYYGSVGEFHSNAGIVHRSQPATPTAAYVAGANTKSKLQIYDVAVQNKMTFENGALVTATLLPSSWLSVYRSTLTSAVLQRLSVPPRFNIGINDPTQQLQSISDSNPDSNTGVGVPLSARPALYTTGGVYEDEQPPAFTTLTLHKSRLWGIDGSRRQIWFSKAFSDDPTVAPGFSSNFRIQLDDAATSLATMDDKLVVFGRTWIRYILGDGPAPNGSGNDLTPPIAIQTDVGCAQPRGTVSTPAGVMFVSDRGIHLLGRSLEVQWIGRPVRDQLIEYPTVTSAVLIPTLNQVRFSCNSADGQRGVVLVYDYVEGQWSTFRYWDGPLVNVFARLGAPIADACLWRGQYTFATAQTDVSPGHLFTEDPTTNRDGGVAYVPMVVETAWLSAAGPLAFQSVREFSLEGISNDNHNLTIDVGFDGDLSYPQSRTFAAGSAVTTVGPMENCDVTIGTRRKCQSIRFRISDSVPSDPLLVTTGKGPSLDMLGIDVGIKRGFVTKPDTNRG